MILFISYGNPFRVRRIILNTEPALLPLESTNNGSIDEFADALELISW